MAINDEGIQIKYEIVHPDHTTGKVTVKHAAQLSKIEAIALGDK